MELVFTPWALIGFLSFLGGCYLAYRLQRKKHFKAALVVIGLMLLVVIFKPVRLAVNPAPIERAERLIESRHSELPPRIKVESKTFDEVLKESSERIEQENKAIEKDVLGV